MDAFPQFKYTGATPGADANTYLLYSTTGTTTTPSGVPGVAPPARFFALIGARKFVVELKLATAGGTLNSYVSDDRGVNWRQQSTEVVTVPVSSTVERVFDVLTAPDWKLEWVNGSSAQTAWFVGMAVSGNLI